MYSNMSSGSGGFHKIPSKKKNWESEDVSDKEKRERDKRRKRREKQDQKYGDEE